MQSDPEVNLDKVFERIRSLFGRSSGGFSYIVLGIFLVITVIWGASGFFQVSTVGGEVAVLKLFGKYAGERGTGLHWFWPSPIGTKTIVRKDERRLLELGFRGTSPVTAESLMITGDENIVDVQLLVQYNIKSPRDFLFNVVDPEGVTLRDTTETSLRQVVGSRLIDDVLTDQKEAVQQDTKDLIQSLLDDYGTGIRITEVKLQNVNPPAEVRDAFDDVVRAKEDKERIVNLSDAYKEQVLPTAKGQAAKLREAAEAARIERVNLAKGQAQRFTAILSEYRESKEVTRQRLYLEAMELILPDITKVILDDDSGVLPILPLSDTSLINSSKTQVSQQEQLGQ